MNAVKWMVAGLILLGGCTAERRIALNEDGTLQVDDKLKLFPETMRFLRDQAAGQDSVMQWLARIDQSPTAAELKDWRRKGLDVRKWKVKTAIDGPAQIRTRMLLESASVRATQIEPRLMLDLDVQSTDEPDQLRVALGLPGTYMLEEIELRSVVGLSEVGGASEIDFVLDVPGKVLSTFPAANTPGGPEVTIQGGNVRWRFTPIQLANQGSGAQVAVVFQVPGVPSAR